MNDDDDDDYGDDYGQILGVVEDGDGPSTQPPPRWGYRIGRYLTYEVPLFLALLCLLFVLALAGVGGYAILTGAVQ
tara:strand:+ start:309 stop:536 length:228 start_codon:yes stop_codon:yes gene_type:complete